MLNTDIQDYILLIETLKKELTHRINSIILPGPSSPSSGLIVRPNLGGSATFSWWGKMRCRKLVTFVVHEKEAMVLQYIQMQRQQVRVG